jgi:hypothetical protein
MVNTRNSVDLRGDGRKIVHTDDWVRSSREKNEMTNGTKNHSLQKKVVGLLVERSVAGDDGAYLTGGI